MWALMKSWYESPRVEYLDFQRSRRTLGRPTGQVSSRDRERPPFSRSRMSDVAEYLAGPLISPP
jgi:hypothetical protein